MIEEARRGRKIRLGGGRALGYDEYGDPRGRPVVFLHGFGACRSIAALGDAAAGELGVRLIAPDRPGIGLSDRLPGRGLLDFPADVAALADALGARELAVVGWSAGGPYALACAFALPDRITGVALVSSAPPLSGRAARHLPASPATRAIGHTARFAPFLMRPFFAVVARRTKRDPERALEESLAELPAADRAVLGRAEVRANVLANVVEVFRSGGAGVSDDALALARPWGFRPADIGATVHLWHGGADTVWPIGVGHWLAGALPSCRAVFLPGEGHYALFSRWREVLATVAPS
jgi:pimeloyl-ACP methyl ester carboxylesterase